MAGVGTILVAAGSSERIGAGLPKQFVQLAGRPMFLLALDCAVPHSDEIVVVTRADDLGRVAETLRAAQCVPAGGDPATSPTGDLVLEGVPVAVVEGGRRRQDSVAAGLASLSEAVRTVLIHDAARPFATADLAARVVAAAEASGAAIPAAPVPDTVKEVEGSAVWATPDRARLRLAQTPQGFARDVIEEAYRGLGDAEITDDARAVELAGVPVTVVPGEPWNFKVTTPADLDLASAVAGRRMGLGPAHRAGVGSDTHRLVAGRDLVLSGVTIPFDLGLDGHSDADVATHAVCDALLGAVAEGDIGLHFPPGDPEYRGISSLVLLERVAEMVRGKGYDVANVDVMIVAEAPKLAPHVPEMRATLAATLGIDVDHVSVKATTTEGTGPEGEGAAITSTAIAVVVERPSR
jgi:2-C-methyl-D-erythritol 4-phosphate cytidylyltransferase/2-C-methyl-D-erythritol 2,4-cyclodiphosphate synthase